MTNSSSKSGRAAHLAEPVTHARPPVVGQHASNAPSHSSSFRAIVDSSTEGAIVILPDESIAYANDAAESLLSCPKSELRGEMFGLGGSALEATEVCVAADDRRVRSVEMNIVPIQWKAAPARLVLLRDVTIYRDSREQAKRETQKLNHFLATLSHELRNPLGALRSAFALLARTKQSSQSYQQALAVGERQFDHIGRLMSDLLDLSRITLDKVQLQREKISLGRVVRDAVATAQVAACKKAQVIVFNQPNQPIAVDGDPTRLQQVVSNLLSNAIRYSHDNSQIHVTLEQQADQAILSVEDSGPGIDEELLPKLFDTFVQGNDSLARADSGLGIGLAIVKRLVQMHRGTISVENRPQSGARFEVRLPCLDPQTMAVTDSWLAEDAQPPSATNPTDLESSTSLPHQAPDAQASSQSGSQPATQCSIIYVEDNPDVRKMMREMLEMEGYRVSSCECGQKALEAIEQQQPDIALLDIGLPEMSGFEVAKRIRQMPSGKGIGLIALTGYGREDDKQRALEAGFDKHLTKPTDFGKLVNDINELSGREAIQGYK